MHYSSIEFMIPAFITMTITPAGLVLVKEVIHINNQVILFSHFDNIVKMTGINRKLGPRHET